MEDKREVVKCGCPSHIGEGCFNRDCGCPHHYDRNCPGIRYKDAPPGRLAPEGGRHNGTG